MPPGGDNRRKPDTFFADPMTTTTFEHTSSPAGGFAGHSPVLRELPSPTGLDAAIDRARDCLLSLQNPSGFWCGELQGDSILESEFILMKFILGQENDPDLPLIANYLRKIQQPDGGWN